MPQLDGAVDPQRDRALVELCQDGDGAAFNELYEHYHRRLLRLCLGRLRTPCDAEEAVQEAFLRAWKALPRLDGERRFYPWLKVIASNVCTDVLRRRMRVVLTDVVEAYPTDVQPGADSEVMRTIELKVMAEAFNHLSERHRRILILRDGTQWSSRRIADQEGVKASVIDVAVWRARQACKREFAALADAGGLASLVGACMTAIHHGWCRGTLRVSSWIASVPPIPVRRMAGAVTAIIGGAVISSGGAAVMAPGMQPVPNASVVVDTPAPASASATPMSAMADPGTTLFPTRPALSPAPVYHTASATTSPSKSLHGGSGTGHGAADIRTSSSAGRPGHASGRPGSWHSSPSGIGVPPGGDHGPMNILADSPTSQPGHGALSPPGGGPPPWAGHGAPGGVPGTPPGLGHGPVSSPTSQPEPSPLAPPQAWTGPPPWAGHGAPGGTSGPGPGSM